jgi:hypothetical protein
MKLHRNVAFPRLHVMQQTQSFSQLAMDLCFARDDNNKFVVIANNGGYFRIQPSTPFEKGSDLLYGLHI